MALVTGARCGRHPEVSAVEICQRCGRFVCGECLALSGSEPYCSDCYARFGPNKASNRAVVALILSVVGLNCAFLPGLVGLVLAQQELGAIDRGEAAAAGKSLVRAARIIGIVNAVLLVCAAVGGILYLVTRA